MRNVLARRNLATLANFACLSVLLGFDYDGTLAPIAATPARARMRGTTRQLLARVAKAYPCVVISGRAHADLSRRLGGLPLWNVFGNHGIEPLFRDDNVAKTVANWVQRLRNRLAAYPGVVVEDKTYSVTVHYRHAPRLGTIRRVIAAAVRGLPNARAIDGDLAVNLIIRDGPDKASTLQRVRRVLSCDAIIYVGDDDTDEGAFASAPSDQLLAIRVGCRHTSGARYYLKSQRDIDALLKYLLAMRSRQAGITSLG